MGSEISTSVLVTVTAPCPVKREHGFDAKVCVLIPAFAGTLAVQFGASVPHIAPLSKSSANRMCPGAAKADGKPREIAIRVNRQKKNERCGARSARFLRSASSGLLLTEFKVHSGATVSWCFCCCRAAYLLFLSSQSLGCQSSILLPSGSMIQANTPLG